MLAEAIGKLSRNNGAQRKDIWKYCMEKFTDQVKYVEFLQTINKLIKGGKLEKNEFGYYWIQKEVYQELYKDCIEGKLSVGSKAAQTEMGQYKSSVTKSLGRLSVSHRKFNQYPYQNAHRTCGPMSAMNGKNFYGAHEIPAKKQSRDKSYDQIGISNIHGKKKSINSGGAKIGKGSRGSKGLSQVTVPSHFDNTQQMMIDQFVIPAPIDQINSKESQLYIDNHQIGGQDSSSRRGGTNYAKNGSEINQKGIAKNTRSRRDAKSEAPYDHEAPVSLSELPDKNIDPMLDIKNQVKAEILMYQQRRREKKNKEKRKNQELQSQIQESQYDVHSNNEQPQVYQDQEKARVMTRNQQAQQQIQQTADTSAQTAKNHNTKLGKKVEGNIEQRTPEVESNIGDQKPVNDFDLGFRSRSHSQSQMSKSENNDYNDRISQIDKNSKPIFGFQSPTKREGDTSLLSYTNNKNTIEGPEDLYPTSITHAKPENNQRQQTPFDELSLQDIEECQNDQQGKLNGEADFNYDDLNINSEDEKIMRDIQGNHHDYDYTNTVNAQDQNDDGLSQYSYAYGCNGVLTRRKRRQLENFEMEASQMSVMSDSSRYSLRPRTNQDASHSHAKRQRHQEKHSKGNQNGKGSHIGGKVSSSSKSPNRGYKKAEEKYHRKHRQSKQSSQKTTEFKSPVAIDKKGRSQVSKSSNIVQGDDQDDTSQNDQGCSLRATLSGGFGNYHTRNYSHFQDAMSQVVTRNKFSTIISQRPQVNAMCKNYLQKSCHGQYDKGLFTRDQGSDVSNMSKYTASGQKRRNPYQNDRYSQINKMQKTPTDFEKRITRNQSHSAMTAMATRSRSTKKHATPDLFNMQKQKKQIQQQMALDKVMKKSTFTGSSNVPIRQSRSTPQVRPHNANINLPMVAKNVDLSINKSNQQQTRTTRSSHQQVTSDVLNSQGQQNNLRRSTVSPDVAARQSRSTARGLNERSVDNGLNTKRVEGNGQHHSKPQPTAIAGQLVLSAQVASAPNQNVAFRQKQNEKLHLQQSSQRSRNPVTAQAQNKGSMHQQQGAPHRQDPRKESVQMSQTFTQSGRPTMVPNYHELHKQGKNNVMSGAQMMYIARLYGQKVSDPGLANQQMVLPIPSNGQHHSQSTAISGSDNTSGISPQKRFSAQKLQHVQPAQSYPVNQSQRSMRQNAVLSNAQTQMAHMQPTHGMPNQPNWLPNCQLERESKLTAMMKLNTSSAMNIQTNNQEFRRN